MAGDRPPAGEWQTDTAFGLEASCYTDPDFHRRERERILTASWQLACHISDLPGPGTVIRFDFMGRSAIAIRGQDGGIRAFLNVCRHRGSRLVDGDPQTGLAYCVDNRLRCPYHAWVYGDNGDLLHVPHESRYPGLQRDELALYPLPVEVWLGFVFVAFASPESSVARMMQDCTAELEPYRFAEMRRLTEPRLRPRNANWKVICENYLDSHHLGPAHPTLKQLIGRSYGFQDRGDVMTIRGELETSGSGSWSARAYLRWLSGPQSLPADRRRLWSYYFVWPNLALDVYPDQIDFMQMLPTGTGETLIREIAYAIPDPRREMKLTRYLNWRINRQVNREDQRLIERTQAGLESGDYRPGPIAADERGLRWFTGRIRKAMDRQTNDSAARR